MITSCTVSPIGQEDDTPMTSRPKPPKGGNRAIIYAKAGELLRKAGDRRPEDAPASLPPGRPAINIETAIDELASSLPVEPKRRHERARAAVASLVSSGLLKLENGWLWCP